MKAKENAYFETENESWESRLLLAKSYLKSSAKNVMGFEVHWLLTRLGSFGRSFLVEEVVKEGF